MARNPLSPETVEMLQDLASQLGMTYWGMHSRYRRHPNDCDKMCMTRKTRGGHYQKLYFGHPISHWVGTDHISAAERSRFHEYAPEFGPKTAARIAMTDDKTTRMRLMSRLRNGGGDGSPANSYATPREITPSSPIQYGIKKLIGFFDES